MHKSRVQKYKKKSFHKKKFTAPPKAYILFHLPATGQKGKLT